MGQFTVFRGGYILSRMKLSRRDLALLMPALLPAVAVAQTSTPSVSHLPSSATRLDDITPKPSGAMTARQFFKGQTHSGFLLDLHETELAAGEAPHAPHQHVHEEMLLIREGQLDVTIEGKTTKLDAGSVAFLTSGQMHGVAKHRESRGPVFRPCARRGLSHIKTAREGKAESAWVRRPDRCSYPRR